MEDEQMISIVEQMNNWCSHCQLYAVKFFIWNTDKEQLEEIIALALDALSGCVSPDDWPGSIRASFKQVSKHGLLDLRKQIDVLLEMSSTEMQSQKGAIDEESGL